MDPYVRTTLMMKNTKSCGSPLRVSRSEERCFSSVARNTASFMLRGAGVWSTIIGSAPFVRAVYLGEQGVVGLAAKAFKGLLGGIVSPTLNPLDRVFYAGEQPDALPLVPRRVLD